MQSENRFNQGYYQPQQYDSNPQQQTQSRFSPYTPETVNTTFGSASPQNPTLIQSNLPPNPNKTFIVPNSNVQNNLPKASFYREKAIQDYYQRFNVRRDSTIYQFLPYQLQTIMVKFQKQFPIQFIEQIKKNERQVENGPYSLLKKMFLGTLLYWVILRRNNWFKLTHNTPLKVIGLITCEIEMRRIEYSEMLYFTQRAFANYKSFENVIQKYGINSENVNRLQLAS